MFHTRQSLRNDSRFHDDKTTEGEKRGERYMQYKHLPICFVI